MHIVLCHFYEITSSAFKPVLNLSTNSLGSVHCNKKYSFCICIHEFKSKCEKLHVFVCITHIFSQHTGTYTHTEVQLLSATHVTAIYHPAPEKSQSLQGQEFLQASLIFGCLKHTGGVYDIHRIKPCHCITRMQSVHCVVFRCDSILCELFVGAKQKVQELFLNHTH